MFERFTQSARAAVTESVQQARNLHAGEVGAEHILLALVVGDSPVLTSVGFTADGVRAAIGASVSSDADDAAALRSVGIDLDAVRRTVESNIGPDAWTSAPSARRRTLFGKPLREPFNANARKVLELALREAIARHDRAIRDEHLILGIARGANDVVRAVIETQVPVPELREQALAALMRSDAA